MYPKLNFSRGMARPFMFAALCQRAHPLKHSLAESIFVSRVQKTSKKSSLAEKFVSRVNRQPRYHCNAKRWFTQLVLTTTGFGLHIAHHQVVLYLIIQQAIQYAMFLFFVDEISFRSIKFAVKNLVKASYVNHMLKLKKRKSFPLQNRGAQRVPGN